MSSSAKLAMGMSGATNASTPSTKGHRSKSGPENSNNVCITQQKVTDGEWHSVFAARFGHSLVLQLDAGEAWQFNETLPLFGAKRNLTEPVNFWVDIREGVLVGGIPEYIKRNVSLVLQDLSDGKKSVVGFLFIIFILKVLKLFT